MYLIFDVGGVLLTYDESIGFRALQKLGVATTNAPRLFGSEYREFSRGNIDETEFSKALNTHFKNQLRVSQLREAHDVHLLGLDHGTVKILNLLHQRGTPLAFITDTNLWQTAYEQKLIDLTNYSDQVFRSHETHFLKQDEGCFPFILKSLKISPSETLLIDDSPLNIAAAQRHGLKTLLFKNSKELKMDLEKMGLL